MSIYRKLQKKVYDIIYPDGIPLKFGCEAVEESSGSWFYYKEHGLWQNYVNPNRFINFKDFDGENLGKPLSLQDIFRVLKIKTQKAFSSNTGNYIDFNVCEKDCINIILSSIDLSKEIEHQNEEVLQKIYNLIK